MNTKRSSKRMRTPDAKLPMLKMLIGYSAGFSFLTSHKKYIHEYESKLYSNTNLNSFRRGILYLYKQYIFIKTLCSPYSYILENKNIIEI